MQVTVKPGMHKVQMSSLTIVWANSEDDEREGEQFRRRPYERQNSADTSSTDRLSTIDSVGSQDVSPPRSPSPRKPGTADAHHSIRPLSHHVVVSSEILTQQNNLDTPYDPRPWESDSGHEKQSTLANWNPHDPKPSTARTRTKTRTLWGALNRTLLHKGYIPLALRLTAFIFAVIALILAAYITKYSIRGNIEERPSTIMAFVVNTVALFYLPWIAKVNIDLR